MNNSYEPTGGFEKVHDFHLGGGEKDLSWGKQQELPQPQFTQSIEGTHQHFDYACTKASHLFQDRNKEYDSAFRKYGLLGVVFEILGIVSRLPPMTIWKLDRNFNRRKLQDLFMDLHNYSNMALILLDENNWDGRNPIYEQTGDEPGMRS